MAEITPELAMRLLETLIGKKGTPYILQAPDPDDESRTLPVIEEIFRQADYERIIKRYAPQMGGIKWNDLQNAGLLNSSADAINFAALTTLARECPDYDQRLKAVLEKSPSARISR